MVWCFVKHRDNFTLLADLWCRGYNCWGSTGFRSRSETGWFSSVSHANATMRPYNRLRPLPSTNYLTVPSRWKQR